MKLNGGFTYRETVAAASDGMPVLEYLTERHAHSLRSEWRERLNLGRIQINGRVAEADAILSRGEVVTWERPPWQEPEAPLHFEVLHEDGELLAVDKPSGLPTLPGAGFLDHTLQALVQRRFPAAAAAHRLGRFTSGIVLFACTPAARAFVAREWSAGRVFKRYLGLATGSPARDEFTVEAPIGRVPHPLLGTIHAACANGRRARSHVRVLERHERHFLAEVVIETGRPHQIRIHLAAAGHPLVGDPLYVIGGGPGERANVPMALPGDGGYWLRAVELSLAHPMGGGRITLVAPDKRTFFHGGGRTDTVSGMSAIDSQAKNDPNRRADIRPFRAWRYTAGAGDPSLLLCPPYDVISPAARLDLLRRSPANAVRIELPVEEGRLSRQEVAGHTIADWRTSGVLERDPVPAFYRHDHGFEWDGRKSTRRGFFARVRLEDPSAGIIKPHEKTLGGPREDRVEMLRRVRAMTSAVFGVYRATTALTEPSQAPLLSAGISGESHRLWAVHAQQEMAALRHGVDGAIYIADGHHRYAAALAYRDECRQAAAKWSGEEPENFALFELVPAEDLFVLPTHRLVAPDALPADFEARLARVFHIEPAGADPVGRLADAGTRGPAFILLGPQPAQARLLTPLSEAALASLMPAGRGREWCALDTAILQEAVLRASFDIDETRIAAGALRFTHQAGEAAMEVLEGRAGVALLLNPTPVEQVMAVADVGELMPQKSTYFHPKLPTGLVFYGHDSD